MPSRRRRQASAADVSLATFEAKRHLPLLAAWLRRPHVGPWWGDPAHVLEALESYSASAAAVIQLDGAPVGFLCWQRPTPAELAAAGLDDLPAGLVDIDIMIGEPDALGGGVGPAALLLLLERLAAAGVGVVGVGTAAENRRALRAFAKAEFRLFRTFRDDDREMCYLTRTIAPPGA